MPSWDNSLQSKVASHKSKFIISTHVCSAGIAHGLIVACKLGIAPYFFLFMNISLGAALDLKCNMSKEGEDNNKKLRVERTSLCTSCQWRQHHQQETEERHVKIEAATKYRNSNANETDEEREHWLQTPRENVPLEFATKAMRRGNADWKFTVEIMFFNAMIGSKNYTICK